MPQPDSPTRPTLSPWPTRKADAVDRAEQFGLDRRLAGEQFAEHGGRALARIFLHQFLDQQQRFCGGVDRRGCRRRRQRRGIFLRQQIAQGDAEPRRRAHQLLGIGVFGVGEDVGGFRGLDHAALFHHHHAVAIGGGQPQIMRDQDGRHAAPFGQFDDQVHHRLLRRDVEAGGRLVRDQELRIAGQRQRDHDALAHAAGEFERIGMIALARTRDLDLLQRLDRLLAAIADLRLLHVLAQHVLDLVADFADRVERRARVLEDHRDFAAAQIAHLVLGRGLDVDAGEHHRALGDLAGAVEDPHHGIGRHRFAGAGLADDAERLALGHGDVDVLHRLDDAAPCREFHREIVDVEQWLRGHKGLFVEHDLFGKPVPTFPDHAATSSAADRRCRADRRRAG